MERGAQGPSTGWMVGEKDDDRRLVLWLQLSAANDFGAIKLSKR